MTKPTWNNSHHWPVCHRTQPDAGLPAGPIADPPVPMTRWQHFCAGVLVGLLLVGPALEDLWAWLS